MNDISIVGSDPSFQEDSVANCHIKNKYFIETNLNFEWHTEVARREKQKENFSITTLLLRRTNECSQFQVNVRWKFRIILI